jgi:hypothetical protein
MTERDSDTGQSTAEEPRFGQEALEAKAGYVPFKDTTDADPEEGLTIDQPLRMIFRARSRKISKRTASAFPDGCPARMATSRSQWSRPLCDDARRCTRHHACGSRADRDW